MKKVPAAAMVAASLASGLLIQQAMQAWDARYDNFNGVGGREVYEAQRAFHIERLKANQYVSPEVREQDSRAIDGEAQELGQGYPPQELGENLRRIK
ncbi:hypothetical protein GC170_14590 [bacterium]|nr:hypothetical protein [bacterium]